MLNGMLKPFTVHLRTELLYLGIGLFPFDLWEEKVARPEGCKGSFLQDGNSEKTNCDLEKGDKKNGEKRYETKQRRETFDGDVRSRYLCE